MDGSERARNVLVVLALEPTAVGTVPLDRREDAERLDQQDVRQADDEGTGPGPRAARLVDEAPHVPVDPLVRAQ